MTEYEVYGSFDINFSAECLGKLEKAKIKKLLKETLEEYFEKNDNVCTYDIGEIDESIEYEVLE